MSAEDIKSRLNLLNEDEREMLRVACEHPKLSDKDLSSDDRPGSTGLGYLNWSSSTVRSLRSSAMAVLRPYTLGDVCPYLLGTVEEETPQQRRLTSAIFAGAASQQEQSDDGEETGDNGGDNNGDDGSDDSNEEENGGNRRLLVGIIIFAVALALLVVGVNWIITQLEPVIENPPSPPEIAATVAEAVLPEETDTPVVVTSLPEVITVVLTPTPIPPTPGPSPTPLPTNTPKPTNTPRPTATPFPLPFEDDFSSKKEVWNEISGIVNWSGGILSANQDNMGGGDAWLSVGDPNWTDYVVEFDAYSGTNWPGHYTTVGVRANGPGDMAAYWWNSGSGSWRIRENNNWRNIPNTGAGGTANQWKHFRITVKGDSYTIDIDGLDIDPFFDSTHTKGNVVIGFNSGSFDNFYIHSIEE